jgi:hypothetical protein
MRVRLTSEVDGAVCLESPYDAAFVESLKLALDYGGRSWDATRKRWIVSALYVDILMQFLQDYGAHIIDDRVKAQEEAMIAPPPMPTDLKDAFDALYLAYTAPLCVAVASYRALSKYWHPDKGGDATDFDRVATAIEVIRSYLDPKEEQADGNDVPF